jgi:hypothetical protein
MRQNFSHVSSDIWILYKATTAEFERGYDLLFSRSDDLSIRRQRNGPKEFQLDTKALIKLSKSDYICFFVDDNIVYQPPNIFGNQVENVMNRIEEAGCFSFRLGLNTVVQDPYTKKPVKAMPKFHEIDDTVLAWDWTSMPLNNFSYPFSVDGHIYNKRVVLDALDYEFDTPNAFEGRFPPKKIPRGMFCLKQSCVVNNPLNLVGSSQNKAGVWHGRTLEELNEAYLNGQQINMMRLCANEIVGCHQEMEIEMEPAT